LIDSPNLFWDACVFYRYITRVPAEGLNDLDELVRDAESGRRKIYFSTLCFAEVRPSFLKPHYGRLDEFIADLGKAFEPIDPNPNILLRAGSLKDHEVTDPGTMQVSKRVVGTADAIHLMTCLFLRDAMGVSDIVFQTYDEGKGTSWEGKCVPLLGFERWYPEANRSREVEDVCGLVRARPLHPQSILLPPVENYADVRPN
jgi:hypothetical protein